MSRLVSKAVGIDLGTTNSAVAVMNPTDSDVLIHKDPVTKSPTTPSCVWREPGSGEIVVGRKAFNQRGRRPEPVTSVKRLMGTRSQVALGDREYSPQQVSAFILAEMKRQIEADVAGFGGADREWIADRAVVTVPAYFDQPQIEATREAAESAGLAVLDLLHEPTAAASYHCWRTATQNGTFLVYDLGGGTFDVSVLRCTGGTFEVLGISGNNLLGGDDIDAALARHLQAVLSADGYALDLDPAHSEDDRSTFIGLKLLAESAKKALSRDYDYMLRDAGTLTDQAGKRVNVEVSLERAELEGIARPFIERTFPLCDEAIARAHERAGITLADVDQVILAGGSTHMPLVRELVARELCGRAAADSPRQARAKCGEPIAEQVDTVVALGAAVRAAAVGGLAVYDEDRAVRISLRGTGTTGAGEHTVGGRVESLVAGVDLAGGRVLLDAGGYPDEADLAPDGSFAFSRIPLQPDGETELAFEVYDADGELRATAGRAIQHTSGVVKPTGSTENSAVTSKAIKLEVRLKGEKQKFELVPALGRLPYARDYEFRHPGGVETVELRLFQESRPIQVVRVPVSASTPKDTPILMHLVMHENHSITVEGGIGDAAFQAQVSLPVEEEVMPDQAEIDALHRRFQENISALPVDERAGVQTRFTMAQRALSGARERGDVQQAVHERNEVESIVEKITRHDSELEPPKAEFDDLVSICVTLHSHLTYAGVPSGMRFESEEIARTIEEHRGVGERAYTDRDQRRYSDAASALNAMREHLLVLARGAQTPQEIPDTTRAQQMLDTVHGMAAQLRTLARNLPDPAAEAEVGKISERARRLEEQVPVSPGAVIQEAGRLQALLGQLKARLGAREDIGDEDAVLPEVWEGRTEIR
jgi:molecular chaperone DnaK